MHCSAASPFFSRQGAFFLLTLCLLSTGCAGKYGPQLTQVNYYPQCYRSVAELRQDESSVNTSTGVGTAGSSTRRAARCWARSSAGWPPANGKARP